MSNHAAQVHLGTAPKSRFEAEPAKLDNGHIAPDCAGLNFYEIDPSFRASLRVNMDAAALTHFEPLLQKLGAVAGNELDTLARLVDRNPPVLEPRDRFGRDLDTIVYHPAYREMEKIGFEDFQLHSM